MVPARSSLAERGPVTFRTSGEARGSLDAALRWLRDATAELREALGTHGAVLVRDLPVQSVADVARARDVILARRMASMESFSPRKILEDGLFSPVRWPPERVRANSKVQRSKGLELGGRRDGRMLLLPVILVDVEQSGDSNLEATIETQAEKNRAFELWRTIRRARRAGTVTKLRYSPEYVNGPQVEVEEQWPRSGQEVSFVQVP